MSNKKRRQRIIVSHSAPIVVNGDAEYIISMQHDRTGLYPGLCGALQEAPRRGKHNRLGIALQFTTARFLGTFLTDLNEVLSGIQQFVAAQLNIRCPEVLSRYAERDTTLREHTALIKEYYGYNEFGDFSRSFRLKRLL